MNFCVYGAASDAIDASYMTAGEELGKKLATAGHGVVFGAGAHGMMGAVARGVHSCGGKLIGIAPSFFQVDGVLFEHCTEIVYTETMRERKQIMEDRSDAFLVTPGGIGTYDEFFEIMTLRQLGRHTKPIVLYNINGYFDPLYEMLLKTAEKNFMKKENLSLIFISDRADEILEYVENFKPEIFDPAALRGIITERTK